MTILRTPKTNPQKGLKHTAPKANSLSKTTPPPPPKKKSLQEKPVRRSPPTESLNPKPLQAPIEGFRKQGTLIEYPKIVGSLILRTPKEGTPYVRKAPKLSHRRFWESRGWRPQDLPRSLNTSEGLRFEAQGFELGV